MKSKVGASIPADFERQKGIFDYLKWHEINKKDCVAVFKSKFNSERANMQSKQSQYSADVSSFFDRGLFDRKSLDRNCVLSVDQNFHNQLTEIFEAFQLIEKFDQLPKNNLQILAVDRKF